VLVNFIFWKLACPTSPAPILLFRFTQGKQKKNQPNQKPTLIKSKTARLWAMRHITFYAMQENTDTEEKQGSL